jgi:hypothetical protein
LRLAAKIAPAARGNSFAIFMAAHAVGLHRFHDLAREVSVMSKALPVRRSFSIRVVQRAFLLALIVTLSVSGLAAGLQSRLVFWNRPRKGGKKHGTTRQKS